MSIVQGTLPVGSLDHAITLNVQSSGGSHFETVTDSTPYLHRASPQDVANSMKLKKVVGGTIAWHQHNKNDRSSITTAGVTWSTANGIMTAQGKPSARSYNYSEASQTLAVPSGHVLLSMVKVISGTVPTDMRFGGSFYLSSTWVSGWTSTKLNTIVKVPSGADRVARTLYDITANAVTLLDGGSVDMQLQSQLFDLTQMFGSTIADYIYSLEQAHAGDGVAWFKSLFGEDYYPYNSGELMSVKTSAHKTVGKNFFDRASASENKLLTWAFGTEATEQKSIVSDYIRVLHNVPLTTNYNAYIFGYDANKTYIGVYKYTTDEWIKAANWTVTNVTISNTNVCYIRLVYRTGVNNNTDMVAVNDIYFEIVSSNNTYEPYTSHSYPLDSDLELRGIPKLDSNHELYYDGDTYASDGTVTRKYGIRAYTEGDATDGSTMITDGTNTVYKLITPTTESADAYTQSQRVGATEEFVDGRTVEIPVGNVSEYKRLIQED